MWADEAVPRLRALGLGADVAVRTFRLTGIGESQVAERLGEAMLRGDQPGRGDLRPGRSRRRPHLRDGRRAADGRGARRGGRRDRARPRRRLTSGRPARRPGARRSGRAWTSSAGASSAVGDRDRRQLRRPGRRRALVPVRRVDRARRSCGPRARVLATTRRRGPTRASRPTPRTRTRPDGPGGSARTTCSSSPAERASSAGSGRRRHPCRERAGDTVVSIAVSTPNLERKARRIVFQTGPLGRSRTALAAAAFVLEVLRTAAPAD